LIEAARARIADLSPAQHGVLLALADGQSNKEIARDLGVTEATIKAHLTAIFRKLKVANRAQALLAIQPLIGSPGR
jgi:DNA-binding NarL/FixJ family response regulator